MNARQHRKEYDLSPLDFPAIQGPGESGIDIRTEPPIIVNKKVKLKITVKFVLVEFYNRKKHVVLTAFSVYEIPINEIKSRENVYEYYQDAILGLSEAYNFAKKQLPLPDISFNAAPIETYKQEIDGVLYLINTLN